MLRDEILALYLKYSDVDKCEICGSDYWPPAGGDLWHNADCPIAHLKVILMKIDYPDRYSDHHFIDKKQLEKFTAIAHKYCPHTETVLVTMTQAEWCKECGKRISLKGVPDE